VAAVAEADTEEVETEAVVVMAVEATEVAVVAVIKKDGNSQI
jgi:hypothetical protein